MVIMKFQYRIVVAFAVVAVASVILLLYYDRRTSSSSSSYLDLQQRDAISSEPEYDDLSNILPAKDLTTQRSTTFRNMSPKKKKRKKYASRKIISDIQTINLLQQLNDNYDLHLLRRNRTLVNTVEIENNPKRVGSTLEVIVVPHSHNDPGWHKTVDGYFDSQTKPTLNNMVIKLLKYPKMKFVWAETVFLSMWWKDLDEDQRKAVKDLIFRRQLEIVGGGWVVPDEANTHYFAVIDQMIEGHQWLEENLGVRPRNTWSLDPFGYSSALAYLHREAMYENLVILRVHTELKQLLEESRSLEFYWRQTWDHSNRSDIYTLMMPYMLYNIKHSCGPDPAICLKFDFRKVCYNVIF